MSAAARVLHALLKAHRRWWLTAHLVRKVVAARKAIRQVWEVVGLERSLEVVPLARPGEVKGPAKSDYRPLLRKPYTARIEPTYVSCRLVPPKYKLRWVSIGSAPVIHAPFSAVLKRSYVPWYPGERPSCLL